MLKKIQIKIEKEVEEDLSRGRLRFILMTNISRGDDNDDDDDDDVDDDKRNI